MYKKKLNILCPEPQNFSTHGLELFKKYSNFCAKKMTQNQFEKNAPKYDILLVRLEREVNRNIIDNSKYLKAIVSPTTGIDHINIIEAKKRNIDIICLKGEKKFLKTIPSTAEHTWALLLSIVRNISQSFSDVKKYNWRKDIYRGMELKDKNLCILGYGRLGSMLAKYGLAFGMNVFFYDTDTKIKSKNKKIKRVKSLDELLKLANILTIHIPLDSDTVGFIGEKQLSSLPKGAFLINTSRALIVDEKSLIKQLYIGHLKGAAVDVINNEIHLEKEKNNPLVKYAKKYDNLLITPHIGGATFESVEKADLFIFNKFINRF